MLVIEDAPWRIMITTAAATFPEECCGFMFGRNEGLQFRVTHCVAVNNQVAQQRQQHYAIDPNTYLWAERWAERQQTSLLGIFHSHPNCPAVPSNNDQLAAQPNFSYLIMSIYNNVFDHAASWRLNQDGKFMEERMIVDTYPFQTKNTNHANRISTNTITKICRR